jgi:signal transduction histidine kinase/integral membrane sensor domain MASE1/CheY-like chemotaxis protein
MSGAVRARLPVDVRELRRYLIFVVVYIVAAKIGFLAAFVAEQVSPVWPATGLALWAVLRFGPQVWPAIWLGAVLANVTTQVPIISAAFMAAGNTLEALAGAWMLRRFGDIDRSLDRLRQVVTLIIGAGILSTTISATLGVLTLCGSGIQPWERFTALWWTWWLGDATGAVLVAPLLLTVPLWTRTKDTIIGVAALEALTITVSVLVFLLWPRASAEHHRLEYVVFPLVMWAGFRFAHPGAALVNATVSCIAVWGTIQGSGPFSEPGVSPHDRITLLQIYTAVIATSGLVFGAAIADRNRAERLRETDHMLTGILSQERDLKSAAHRILRTVAETLAWDVGILWRADDERLGLTFVDSWQRRSTTNEFVADSRIREFRRGIGLPGRVWQTAQPAWIYDVVVDPNFPRAEVASSVGLHGGFAFPILAGPRVLGVMEFFVREARRIDGSMEALMAAVGSQIGQFIERTNAQQSVAELLERERAARLEAEGANRSKDQFLATVSHELRTPLTAILGWSSMLRAGEFDPERMPQIHDRIFSNAQAQARIVNDLLDVSRIVSGQLRLEWQRTELCEVARLSVETIRPTAVAKGVTLESDIPSVGPVVSGDPARLQQVMWNLLSNAIKFTPSGGSVALAIRATESSAIVEVTDTGIGIPAAFLPRLFERFWQADSSSTRVHGGLGLGLALARHIVEIHGGLIEAYSGGEGSGSRFVITLPSRESAVQSVEAAKEPVDLFAERPDFRGLSVLVVDDDPAARELFSAILEARGARVTTAESAAEAMHCVARQPADVMLVDIGLPGENGFAVLRRIRAYEIASSRPHAPAIAVTAYATTIDHDEALRSGFVAHVAKPILPHRIITVVQQAATGRV